VNLREIVNPSELFHKEFDFSRFSKVQEFNLKSYNATFEKFKNVAVDYNIDLFICYAMVNDACLDAAHTLKKPIVGFSSFLQSNYD
jgi:hypothetical protein